MSLTVVSPSSYSDLSNSDGVNLSDAQQIITQLQAALQGGNLQTATSLAQTANNLLDALNDAHASLSESLSSGNLSASTASSMMTQLDQIDADASDLEYALTEMGQLSSSASVINSGPSSGSGTTPTAADSKGLLAQNSDAPTANAFKKSVSAGSGNTQLTGADVVAMANQDPSILNSLKQYVKNEAQTSMLDAIMNALGSGSGSGQGNSSGGQAQPATTQGAAPNVVASAQPNVTFDTGAASPLGGFTGTTGSAIPTVSSNLSLTEGGAQAGTGNTASIDGWDTNLGLTNPGDIDEFLMMVLLACYEDGQKGLEQMAQQLQKTNNQKKALRNTLSGLYNQTTGNEQTDAAVDAQIQNVQGQLSDASDDAQLQQLQLQNATQNQQQLLQEISSFSKNLYDASMNILRKIGS